jgi:hypothetical protein
VAFSQARQAAEDNNRDEFQPEVFHDIHRRAEMRVNNKLIASMAVE